MKLKKLLTTLLTLVVFTLLVSATAFAQPYSTVYVDATNGSNAYTGQNETNNPAGTGPKATLAAALPIVAQGGSVVIMAGTYAEPLDLTTGLPGGATPTTNYTLVLKVLNANTDVVFNGNAVVNNANVTVNINQFGTTERLVTNVAAPVINLTAGTINLSNAAAWTMALVAPNTVTYNVIAGRLSNAAPTISGVGAATGIILNYATTANYTAGSEGSYASYGGIGQININNAGFTISFGSAIAFNAANALDVINVINGGATFSSTINLGVGDIINAGGGAVAITGLVSAGMTAGAGVADADLSSIRNTGAGSISANGGITWTGGDFAGAKAYGALFAIDVQSGSVTTGGISLAASNATTVGGANDYSFSFNNIAAASLTVGFVTAALSGDQNFAGSLTLLNAGSASVAGGLYRGTFSNAAGGSVTVSGATIVNGVLTNAGTIALGTNTLTLAGSVAHLTNGGTISASSGGVSVTATGANSFNGGTLSNVTLNGAGGATTFGANAINVTDLTITQGTAAVNINVSASGTVTVNGGTLTIANAVTLTALNFGESAGTVTLGGGASGVLDIKGNFSRTGGTFGAAAGSLLSITGTTNQVVDGGPLFQVVNITFTNSVGSITVNNTIRVSGNAIISTATTVNFGTVNLVLNSAIATIVNNGIYSTTPGSGGGLILGGGNLVTNGFLGGGQTMEGTGIFSYITVDVGAGNIATVVNTLTGVKFNGILRLYTGVLQVTTAGVDFSPFGTSAKIVKHLWGAGAQPALTVTGGTFNNALVPFDLEYATGSDLAALVVSVLPGTIEFPPTVNLVRNLTVSATTTGAGGVLLNAARTFNGNLEVTAGARLILGSTLTSTAVAGNHVIAGAITQSTPAVGEKLVLTGGGTVAGGSGLAQLDAVDFNTTGTYAVSAMKLLGANAATNSVAVLGGAVVNLSMANVGVAPVVDWGNVTNLNVANGRVNLTGDIDVANLNLTVGATGTLDFANFNIWWKSAGSFNGVAASAYLATGATSGGFLQIRANSGINTGGALVPRIIMDPAAAGTFTLTLGGNAGVSEILTNAGDDIIALGANTLTLGGTTEWNHGGTATYTGTGLVNVTGAVNANLGANATIPNLTVNNGTNTFALVDNIAGAGVPTLNVNTLFTMTAGIINFNAVDISLNGAGAVFAYAAGTIDQTTVTGIAATDAQNGELKFNNAAAQTFNVGTTVLGIPNFTIVGAGGVTLGTANPFTVTRRLVFGVSGLTFAADGRMTLADGCWVERNGAATLSHVPAFAGVIDVHYTGAAVIAVDKEMPAATVTPQPLRDLFINTGGGVDVNSTKNLLVGRMLHLNSGNYDFENVAATIFTIQVADSGTVLVTNGNLINGASATVTSLIGNALTLTYNNTAGRTITTREYPATAGFVSTLNVMSSIPGGAPAALVLHASRSCGDFVLNTGVDGPPATTNVQFDLNGFTLTVTNTSSATLTRGVLISNVVAKGVLTSAGIVTSTANVTVTNVNVNAATANLAGVFNGGGTATITGDATFAAFAGNAVVGGNTTLNGLFNGTLTAAGDITGAVNPAFAGGTNLVLNGTDDQDVTVTGSEAFNNLTLNNTRAGSSALLNWITTPAGARTLTLAGTLNLIDGLLVLEDVDALVLPTAVIPFVRNVAVGRQSHVVGNVTIPLGGPVRYEYPVGSLTNYRKAVVEYPGGILTPSPLTVKFIDQAPGGENGFPITNFPGLVIDSTAGFSWLIKSQISQGISQTFNLELYAEGWGLFQDVDSTANLLRAIRRLDTGVENPWTAQTGIYSNFVTSVPSPFPVLRVTATNGGIVAEGSHFTFGLESGLAPQFNVAGTVTYDNTANTPLSNVVVTLNPGGQSDTTDANGNYTITDVANGSYTITATTTKAWGGVNATDALGVLLHTISNPALTGLPLLAADVNNSSSANATDAQQILLRANENISSFAKGDWVFEPVSVTVNNAPVTQNFKGLAVGDVNRSYVPTGAVSKTSPSVVNTVEGKLQVNPTDMIEVPVKVSSDINVAAITLAFTYPKDLVSFESVSSKANDIVLKNNDGKISIAWASLKALDLKADDAIVTLKFKPTDQFKAGSKIDIGVDALVSEIADITGKAINTTLKIAAVEGFVPAEFALKQNYPNPFNPTTTIRYELPIAGTVNLVVFNTLGEVVTTLVNDVQEAGVYKLNWNASELASGIYFYRIDVKAGEKSFTKTNKMILMK